MKNFFEWFSNYPTGCQKPWLIIGKGPTFVRRKEYDLTDYNVLTLNHAIREQAADVAHIIDLDVVDDSKQALLEGRETVVVMPWVPHVRNKAGNRTLEQLIEEHSVLKRLDVDGRLVWYNLGTAGYLVPNSPVVPVRYFSAEAALGLLAEAGVKVVRSLGLDGGISYSSEFEDLTRKTLLANGRVSFDKQFEEIAKIIFRTGVDFGPLDVESPIRLYIAADEAQLLPAKLLEYSIKKRTSMTTDVVTMHIAGAQIPLPRHQENRPRTPFSFQRFLIPKLAGQKGHAVYMDSDMLVLQDLRKLWTIPFDGADLLCARGAEDGGRRPQFSVMLLDCAKLDWSVEKIVADLDSGRLTYRELMYEMKIVRSFRDSIPAFWNSLESYKAGVTALLHYTDMETQPWVYSRNPLGYFWVRDLFDALDDGYISREFICEQVARGFARPSLLAQVDLRIEDPVLLPGKVSALDHGYAAPYGSIHRHSGSPWMRASTYVLATIRHKYQETILYKVERRLRARLSDIKVFM